MNKNKNLAFTLAEVLIVIGIIGVVAALTLPNLNHATGDKETVTRLQKAYSILSEANDRAVAIYGPVSTWSSKSEECYNDFSACYMNRIGEFLKISKSCDENQDRSCDSLYAGDFCYDDIIFQLQDGIIFNAAGNADCGKNKCNCHNEQTNDICIADMEVDVNGPNKGKNKYSYDIFHFKVSDSLGVFANNDFPNNTPDSVLSCVNGYDPYNCTWWVLEYGNLDYLKADENGKCNDSNIILDGTTNTSCH